MKRMTAWKTATCIEDGYMQRRYAGELQENDLDALTNLPLHLDESERGITTCVTIDQDQKNIWVENN